MTQTVLYAGRWVARAAGNDIVAGKLWRLAGLAALIAIALASPELRAVVFAAMRDAYLQVTVFVAGTLIIVYSFEHLFRADLGQFLNRQRRLQAPIAACLGALPGCGGAIIVVTQYIRGKITFGSIVAVLTATMGDAAFLLIAREPLTGLSVVAMGVVVGTISGWVVDAIHGPDFLRGRDVAQVREDIVPAALERSDIERALISFDGMRKSVGHVWFVLLAPGIVLGGLIAVQADLDSLFSAIGGGRTIGAIGTAAAFMCLIMWALSHRANAQSAEHCPIRNVRYSLSQRIIMDTNFVTVWVVFGFLIYELAVYFTGSGIETWLKVWLPLVPLMAVLVGFLPGCGPQIVTTTLYLSGAIPLSAQLANAIANDGDALFPAIALAPRAALIATLYTAVPGLLVGYGWFWLMEQGGGGGIPAHP